MANQEQLALLQKDIEGWNRWRQQQPQTLIDLSNAHLPSVDLAGADLHGANLCQADLRYANLQNASLRSSNLSNAILRGANLTAATCRHADFRQAYLSYASLQYCNLHSADLSETDLSDADLNYAQLNYAILVNADLRRTYLSEASLYLANLYNSDLSYANLRFADLSQSDLRRTNLSYADLSGANLAKAQVLNAKFSYATLTGACIEGWHIGRRTSLDHVKCHCIFRKFDPKKRLYLQRQPENPKSMFAPGEFTFRFQVLKSALSIVDLNFTEGIDWPAFLEAFQNLKQERSDESISVRGIERKGETFVVRLEVDAEADKSAIEAKLYSFYQQTLTVREELYKTSYSLGHKDLAGFRLKQASIPDIIQTIASIDWLNKDFPPPG